MKDFLILIFGSVLIVTVAISSFIYFVPLAHAAAPCHGQSGLASYYGSESGSITASGAHFDPGGMTAASRTLPFGTKLRVTDRKTGRSVVVIVTDRGPAAWTHRLIDLSRGAAQRLGIINRGVARVCLSPAE